MLAFKHRNTVIRVCMIPGFIAWMVLLQSAREVSRRDAADPFAIVELFTSEGCSSCPAADETVARLAKEFKGKVYIIGFHVDYWNNLGWKDVYSSPAFTSRQRDYADFFSLNSMYTPQVVVNGKTELVGSDENKLRATVQRELKTNLPVFISLAAKRSGDEAVTVSYTVSGAEKSVINIALVQLHAVSDVKRGENSGRKLEHINIVRDFATMDITPNMKGDIHLRIPKGASLQDFHIIAYAQAKQGRQVTAAAEAVIQ